MVSCPDYIFVLVYLHSQISSEDSFKKWLAWRQLAPPNPPIDEETEQDENDSVANQIADEWAFLKAHRKQNKEKKQRILFLTEAEARCAGQFSRRRREQLENRHLPQGYEREAVKAQSALERIDSGLASERGSLNSGKPQTRVTEIVIGKCMQK